jgi:hypothetical protein
MTIGELRLFYKHARDRIGEGAFLQTSGAIGGIMAGEKEDDLRDDSEVDCNRIVNVALVRHMLKDAEDGYQGILADQRKCQPDELVDNIDSITSHSMIELVKVGAALGVSYSNETRLIGRDKGDRLTTAAELFVEAVDTYIRACRKAGVYHPNDLVLLDGSQWSERPKFNLRVARMRLRRIVVALAIEHGTV